MSIGPVKSGSAGIEPPTPEKKVRAAVHPAKADLEKSSKVEIASRQKSPIPPLFPEHEVTVQRDTPEDHILIYRVLDKQSGALVLQVPSAEVLNDVHKTQELLQRIAARGNASAAASAVKGEEKNNGSKL
jgi:hypothetical protein